MYIYGNLTSNSVLPKYQSIFQVQFHYFWRVLKRNCFEVIESKLALCLFKSLAIYSSGILLYDCIVLLTAKKKSFVFW